jgi:two-component system, sensor histidine kinase PdtaS
MHPDRPPNGDQDDPEEFELAVYAVQNVACEFGLEASSRITAIARAHQRLYQTETFEKIELGPYLEDICHSFSESLPDCLLHVDIKGGIEVPPDQAIPIALFVNEVITNSAKYGYPNSRCEAWIEVRHNEATISVSVRDKGVGLPAKDGQIAGPRVVEDMGRVARKRRPGKTTPASTSS